MCLGMGSGPKYKALLTFLDISSVLGTSYCGTWIKCWQYWDWSQKKSCARARTERERRQSDDDLAGYIFSISGANCTSGFTSSGSELVVSLPLLFSTALVASVFTLIH